MIIEIKERRDNRLPAAVAALILVFVAVLAILSAIRVSADEDVTPATDPRETAETGFFVESQGNTYWIENGFIQGAYGDPLNITDTIYGIERGREIYDPESDAWYWLDACFGGAVAKSKEVWFPYEYQNEKPGSTVGKWVRYDSNGAMVKFLCTAIDANTGERLWWYYHHITGKMLKGKITLYDNYDPDNPVTFEIYSDGTNGIIDRDDVSKLGWLHGAEWPVYDADKDKHGTMADYIEHTEKPAEEPETGADNAEG